MGRRAKPAALREAQGNPGRRPIPDQQTQAATEPPAAAENPPAEKKVRTIRKLVKVRVDAQRVFEVVGGELRRMNFLRASDEGAFWRYCETFARYWRVTEELTRLGGETYECATTQGGTMLRMRPQFMVQERLAKRLDNMEDRFGLNPMARQQYIMALQRQPQLPLDPPPPSGPSKQGDAGAPSPAPAAAKPSLIGQPRGSLN